MNWNSKKGIFTEVKSDRVKGMKLVAKFMQQANAPLNEIAEELGVSVQRVKELLRK